MATLIDPNDPRRPNAFGDAASPYSSLRGGGMLAPPVGAPPPVPAMPSNGVSPLRLGNMDSFAQGAQQSAGLMEQALPQTMRAVGNNVSNFRDRMAQGGGAAATTGRVLGGAGRDALLTAQSFVDDAVMRPGKAIASGLGDAASAFGQGVLGGAGGATQSQVRAVDNAAPTLAAPTPTLAAGAPTPLAGPPISAMQPVTGAAETGLPNGVTRNGNSFSGMNVGQTGLQDPSGGAPLGSRGDTFSQLASLQAMNANVERGGMTSLANPGPAAAQEMFDGAALRTAAAQGSWSPRGGYKGNDLAVQAALAPIQQRTKLREMSLQNEGRQQEASMRDATERRGQDQTSADRRYSSDQSLRGTLASNGLAAARMQQDAKQSDRQFGLDVQKFGQEQANKNFEQRAAAETAYDKELGTKFVTQDAKGNTVPDTAKVAAFKNAADSTIASMIDAYKKSGTPAHLKMASELENKKFGALDAKDKEEFQQLFERRERMRASGGMGGANFRQSDNLLDYRQAAGAAGVEKSYIGGDRLRTAAGGDVSVNDLRYADGPANALLPDWLKTKSNDLTRNLRGF